MGTGHSSGSPRLSLNGTLADAGAGRDAASRLAATIDGGATTLFLRSGALLSTVTGSSRTSLDTLVRATSPDGRPFTPFGIWSIALP